MLWIVLRGASYQITSANLVTKNGKHEIWVERVNGKGLKITESKNLATVKEIKDAIDYAISKREPTLELGL